MSQYPPPRPLNLRKVAGQQRAIMLCILAGIALIIAQVYANQANMPQLVVWIARVRALVGLVGAVYVIQLALSVYGTTTGILLGMIMLSPLLILVLHWLILGVLPLVNLLVLLFINGKATTLLRQHQIRVGLLGANPSKIPPGDATSPR